MCHVSLSVKGKIPAYSRLILTLPQTDTAIAVNMSLTAVSPPEIPTRTVVMMKIFSVLISVSEMRYDGDVNKCLDKRLCRQRSERHTQTNTRGDSFVCLFCRFWMFSCECWGVLGADGETEDATGRGSVYVCVCLGWYVFVCVYLCGCVSSCLFVCLLVFVGLYICAVYFFVWSVCLIVCFCLCLFVFMYFSFVFFKCVRLCMRAVCFILGMRVCLCVCLYLFFTPIICFYNYCVCVCCLCGLMCLFVCWLVCVFVCLCLCECFCQFVSHLMQFVQFVSLFHCLMDLLSLAVFVLK